jgi:tRNA uridine 5-carbamoylmethylation protein Kti12
MAKVIIPIGIPGSGKTRYFNRINNRQIILLSGDNERGCSGCVRLLLIEKAKLLIKAGVSVYFDSPNITKRGREELIRQIKSVDSECEIIGVHFDAGINVCLENNKQRGKSVPDERIFDMYRHFEKPSLDEGFTKIYTVIYTP